ncbi:MAG: alpha/beta fold hydrolase [Ahrensia sp.]|nr:alpha/beta fold hydrolase [Ahrensia sp.]
MSPIRWFLLALAFLTAGCANNEVILPLAVADNRNAIVQPIHVATMRELSDDGYAVFSGDRSGGLNFAQVDVSIPKDRKRGTIVYPRKVPNLKEQFAAVGHTTNRNEAQFIEAINRSLAQKPPQDRTVFLFVHGYNTNFASGVYRQAQMVHDFRFPGVPVNFSWSSAGRTTLYLYDRESAHLARNGLRDTIRTLSKTDAKSIVLLGHSMGGFVTMEALRDMSIRKETRLLNRLDAVILASPDIDTGVFYEQLAELDPKPDPFILFVSQYDRALQASTQLRGGGSRLGQGSDIERLRELGITVVDLSNVADGEDATNHTTFATSETVMRMVQSGALIQNPQAAQADNNPLAPVGEGIGKLSDLASAIVYLPAKVAGVR